MFSGLLTLISTVRTIIGAAENAVHDRVELFATELVRERQRLFQVLIDVAALTVIGSVTLVLVTFTIVAAFWDTARLTALSGLSGVYLLAFLWFFHRAKKQSALPAFPSTRAQIKRDAALLQPHEQEEARK